MQIIDLRGRKFGYITVLKLSERRGSSGGVYWLCKCECPLGKKEEYEVLGRNLLSGRSTSCGECTRYGAGRKKVWRSEDGPRHGQANSPTYRTWKSMKERCTNPNHQAYAEYGDRGITVCDDWLHSFENFVRDMGKRPQGMTLDRINKNGPYKKENCQWATMKRQNKNRRTPTAKKHASGLLPLLRRKAKDK